MKDEDNLSFVIPTNRLRDVGETVEDYDEHFWCNGHSPEITVFDDSTHCKEPAGSRVVFRRGIRSLAASEPRYNPMAYHNGGIWPHDNALIGSGLARYGMTEEAARVFAGLFDTAMYLDLHRMPELFCGFPRETGEGPVLYPVACSPQAWSAASVFLLFQAGLGLSIDGVASKISLVRPSLPPFLNEAGILNLQVGEANVDLAIVRHKRDVSVKVLRRRGNVEIAVVM